MNPITLLRRFLLLRLALKLLRHGHAYSATNAVAEAVAMWAATASPTPSRLEESP